MPAKRQKSVNVTGRLIVRPLPKDEYYVSTRNIKRPFRFLPEKPSKIESRDSKAVVSS